MKGMDWLILGALGLGAYILYKKETIPSAVAGAPGLAVSELPQWAATAFENQGAGSPSAATQADLASLPLAVQKKAAYIAGDIYLPEGTYTREGVFTPATPIERTKDEL